MNVTREVITDLLPIYFSGEASGDTKVLVEDYFQQDPDFERIARSAATPLATLRAAAPIAADPEKEKRDLESVLWGLRRRKWLFAASLFLTLVPLWILASGGFDASWHAAFDWSLAAVLWFLYSARLRWRTASLVCGIFFTLLPIPFVLHSVFARRSVVEFAIVWIFAAFSWLGYFRQHRS
jgi:heme/copper-type cytochrome/quinol oxidase subunit 4